MCYTSGGAVFLIPYLCCLFLIAIPMYLVETAYGQLIVCKLQHRYAIISKRWWGLSIAQILVCFFTLLYYITLMAWSVAFFFGAFRSPMPWIKEGADQATVVENLWNSDYFYKDILQLSSGIDTMGGLVWYLVLCLFISYVITYFAAWKGLKSTGKIVYVSCLLPYVMLTILLIKGFTLEGAGTGLRYLFVPDWSKLYDASIWQAAGVQILFSSGVGYGPLMYYGTARAPDHKLITASFWIPCINSLTSFYASLTIFTFLGHVSVTKGIPIEDLSKSGPDLVFVAFPALLGLLAGANFWSVIFFAMLVCLGVDSEFAFFDFYLKFIEDSFEDHLKRLNLRQEVIVAILCAACFLLSLQFVAEGGLWVFDLYDQMAGNIAILFCVLLEVIMIPWIFGIDRLEVLMQERTGESIPKVAKFAMRWLVPAFIFAIFILAWVTEFSTAKAEARGWPGWITALGRLIWAAPIISVVIGWYYPMRDCKTIYQLIEEQYGIKFNPYGEENEYERVGVAKKDGDN